MLTRPLELAYDAASKSKLPVEIKARVRKTMRQQQDESAAALGALVLLLVERGPAMACAWHVPYM